MVELEDEAHSMVDAFTTRNVMVRCFSKMSGKVDGKGRQIAARVVMRMGNAGGGAGLGTLRRVERAGAESMIALWETRL